MTEEDMRGVRQIYIVACGSAYHVGVAAQYVIEDLAKIPVRVELASEFRYRKPLLVSENITAQATVKIQLSLFILRTVIYPVGRARCKVWHTVRTTGVLIRSMNRIRFLLRLTDYRISVTRRSFGMNQNRNGL